MSDDEFKTFMVSHGDKKHEETVLWAETFRLAFTANSDPNDTDALAEAMTGAILFAGTLFGTSIIAGLADDKDKRRAVEAMARNFRTGIDVGKARALRIATDQFGGTA